ncbi:MAG: hypothetical protein ACI8RN_002650 [Glaciecola sp.]
MFLTAPRQACASLAILCLLVTSPAVAQESDDSVSKTRWRAEVGVGGEYDTNVSVDEVDLSSGQSDYATIIDLELGVKRTFSERTEASLNYDVSKSSYQEFSAVDRLTHIVGADISTDVGSSNASLSAYYIDSQLDGEAFLKYIRISPSLSGFLSRRWFARGAYVYSEREIDNRAQRDAETQTGELDLYFFHRGLRSYFNLGYRYRDEDAVADELDFDAHSLKLRYIRRVDLMERKVKLEAALRYEVRNYNSAEPTIGEPRTDDRMRLKLDLEIPLTQKFTWQWYLSYGDYISNLPRADFTQTIFGTRLQYTW